MRPLNSHGCDLKCRLSSTRLIILFDIDGTLISSQGAGRSAMNASLREIYGIDNGLDNINLAGSTDRRIFTEFLENHKVEPNTSYEDDFRDWQPVYARQLQEILESDNKTIVHEGINEFISAAEDSGAKLALLTGNVPVGAYYKLRSAGLHTRFFEPSSKKRDDDGFAEPEPQHIHLIHSDSVHLVRANPYNVFGHISENRNDLPAHLPVAGLRYVIVGDTEKDIECAHAHGHISIGVRTGHGDHSAMAGLKPDFMLDTLQPDILKKLLDEIKL